MRELINRRNFLKKYSTAAFAIASAKYVVNFASAKFAGANEKIRAAVIGTNGRGEAHIDCLAGLPGVELAYICDVDDRAIAKGIKATAKRQGTEPKGAKDFRKILEDRSLDAVTIATPDHWHA